GDVRIISHDFGGSADDMALSPNGERLFVAGFEEFWLVGGATSPLVHLENEDFFGPWDYVGFTRDGAKVVLVGRAVWVLDAETGDSVVRGSELSTLNAALSPNGRVIVAGTLDGKLHILDLDIEIGPPLIEPV